MALAIGCNEDLSTVILLRLPAISLLRLRTVSKQWLSIVSGRRFRQIHAASDVAATTGLFFNKGKTQNPELDFLSLDNHTCPMPNLDQPIKILSSSGGLLLLLLQSRDYCICNPTTNEIQSLAAVPQLIMDSGSVSANLAFDPSKSLHYKVLFVVRLPDSMAQVQSQFVIYSSETRTYRSLETIYPNFHEKGIYWNDAIHWKSHSHDCISYFDLSKECMNVSPAVGSVVYFGESRGNLHTVIHTVTLVDNLFEVYELKRDYSGWSLKCQVDVDFIFNELMSMTPISNQHLIVLSILDEEKEGLIMIVQLRDCFGTYTAFSINLKKKLCNVLAPRAHWWYHISYQYKATLACV